MLMQMMTLTDCGAPLHNLVYQASRNQRLVEYYPSAGTDPRFQDDFVIPTGPDKIALDEHKKIVEAFRTAILAHALATEHIENAEQSLLNALRRKNL